jgi:hypothetical protein
MQSTANERFVVGQDIDSKGWRITSVPNGDQSGKQSELVDLMSSSPQEEACGL